MKVTCSEDHQTETRHDIPAFAGKGAVDWMHTLITTAAICGSLFCKKEGSFSDELLQRNVKYTIEKRITVLIATLQDLNGRRVIVGRSWSEKFTQWRRRTCAFALSFSICNQGAYRQSICYQGWNWSRLDRNGLGSN
jgi:hypothetical protein